MHQRNQGVPPSQPPNGGPPHDPEAEAAVLGSILLDAGAIARIRDLVGPDDFYSENNGHVYRAALALDERAEAIDTVTLAGELERADVLKRIGGRTRTKRRSVVRDRRASSRRVIRSPAWPPRASPTSASTAFSAGLQRR